jgi:hypothetical protein
MSTRSKVVYWIAGIAGGLFLAAVIFMGYGLHVAFPDPGPTPVPRTTPAPGSTFDYALWPAPRDAHAATSPRDVARSFVEDFIGVEKPALGAFEQGDARSGDVLVYRRGEDGRRMSTVIATIALRQLDGHAWHVIAASSREVQIRTPDQSLGRISSPLTIAGEGIGQEGNVVLSLHAAFDPKPLAQKPITAGALTPAPFSGVLDFDRPPTPTGAIVARATQPLPGADAFAALPIRFATE